MKLNLDGRQLRRRNIIRTVLIAAVIAALMTVTAFAAGLFSMERHKVEEGEEVSGYWRFYDQEGELTEQQEWTYPEASIVFTFYGPEEEYNMPEFRFGWLPEEGEHYEEQKSMSEGWMYSYGLMCQCDIIPCQAGVTMTMMPTIPLMTVAPQTTLYVPLVNTRLVPPSSVSKSVR